MSHITRPKFFLSRGNGKFTPMIPADELPDHVTVIGVPKVMAVDATFGMISIGEAMTSGRHFNLKVESSAAPQLSALASSLRGPLDVSNSRTSVPGYSNGVYGPFRNTSSSYVKPYQASAAQGIFELNTDRNVTSGGRKRWSGDGHWTQEGGDATRVHRISSLPEQFSIPQSIIHRNPFDTLLADNVRTLGFSEAVSNGGQRQQRGPLRDENKLYCSYWIRHGECDYTQQGCKFLHEFPSSIEGMKAIGLRDYPRWFKEETAVRDREAEEAARATVKAISEALGPLETPAIKAEEGSSDNAVVSSNPSEKRAVQANPPTVMRKRIPRTLASQNGQQPNPNNSARTTRTPFAQVAQTSEIPSSPTSDKARAGRPPIQSASVSFPAAPYMCFYRLEHQGRSSLTSFKDNGADIANDSDLKEKAEEEQGESQKV